MGTVSVPGRFTRFTEGSPGLQPIGVTQLGRDQEKKKGKAPFFLLFLSFNCRSIQDKPMVTIEGDAAWAPQIGVALA